MGDTRCSVCRHTLEEHDNMGWTCGCNLCPWKGTVVRTHVLSHTVIELEHDPVRLPNEKYLRLVTCVWSAKAKPGAHLGLIKWFGRWRGYAFFPAPDTVFEQVCMREIAQFIEKVSKEYRAAKAAAKARDAKASTSL